MKRILWFQHLIYPRFPVQLAFSKTYLRWKKMKRMNQIVKVSDAAKMTIFSFSLVIGNYHSISNFINTCLYLQVTIKNGTKKYSQLALRVL